LTLGLLAVFVAAFSACRYQTIWSGGEFDQTGDIIRLAADEPLCGCLVLKNLSDRDILLRASLHGNELGLQVLPRSSTATARFDWAGPNGEDIYHLEGFDAAGTRVKLAAAVEIIDNGWPWRVCGEATCQYGTLMMNAGENRR
jgi:hypothetical protein